MALTNRYGMPNGAYAQGAQSRSPNREDINPISDALGGGDPISLSSVTHNGQPNQSPGPRLMPMDTDVNTPPMDQPGNVVTATGNPGNPTPTVSQQALQNVLVPHIKGRYTNGDSDYGDAYQIVNNAYNTYLHRSASQPEIDSQFGIQGWHPGGQNNGVIGETGLNAILGSIANSPEARNYVAPSAAASPTQADGTTFNTGADASNGFGGVTYAGFSPQDHQGANLNDPMNAKYALQQYMVQHGALSGGASGNAAAIAKALNDQYGSKYGNANFFNPTDAETIQMPDGTYVHAAPNGYGMQSGTYNPDNTSEVFWGTHNGDSGPSTGSGTPAPTTNSTALPSNIDTGALMNALQSGGGMSPSYSHQLIQQIMQSLATQRALFPSTNGH